MSASETDLNSSNLDNNQLIHTLADVIDKLNKRVSASEDLPLDDVPKVLSYLQTSKDLFKELKEIELYDDINLINNLKENIDSLLLDINTKLSNGDFKGFKGDQGLKGDTGDQGLKGDKGDQGLKGDTGDQGLKGDTGDQGLKGDIGDQGLKGDVGTADFNSLSNKPFIPFNSFDLDDCEIGLFTPTFSVDDGVYSHQKGVYTKIGNVVKFVIDLSLIGAVPNSNHLVINGLPFVSKSTIYGGAFVNYQSNFLVNNSENFYFHISPSVDIIRCYFGVGSSLLCDSSLININGRIILSGWYLVN